MGVATKIDEYAPVMRPTNSASAKSRNVTAPKIPLPTNSSEATGSNATNDVLSDRIRTWFMERFTMSEYVSPRSFPTVGVFSLILSNTTTVSYSEKPRIVRNATTVPGVTSKPVTAYTPTVRTMSWTTAMIAASAIRHSNRKVRYSVTSTKKKASAVSALLLTWSPQVGPTSVTDT